MKLINYGAGEIVDRLTILSLKLHYAEAAGKPAEHFKNEWTALVVKLKAANGVAGYLESLLELSTINGRLWDAEDELRALRVTPEAKQAQWAGFGRTYAEQAMAVAFRIQSLNDRRAELVAAINQQTGEAYGREKLND
jgi:hypothetical protein